MSLWANEVSCYGDDNGPQDPNDNWVVQIMGDVDTASPPTDNFSTNSSRSVVRPVTTRFRLRHLQSGCHFSYHNVILPQWGFKQYEIVCRKEKNADKLGDVIEWAVERIDDRRRE